MARPVSRFAREGYRPVPGTKSRLYQKGNRKPITRRQMFQELYGVSMEEYYKRRKGSYPPALTDEFAQAYQRAYLPKATLAQVKQDPEYLRALAKITQPFGSTAKSQHQAWLARKQVMDELNKLDSPIVAEFFSP